MIIDARSLVTNPNGNKAQDPAAVIGLAVHHTDGQQRIMSEADERAVIVAIDRQHVGQDYGGFGYHGIAFASGRAYFCGEGQRAHVAKRNHQLRGYALHGNFETVMPSDLQLSGLKELLAADRARYPQPLPIKGHKEWALPGEGTACPGIAAMRDWEAFMQPDAPAPTPDGLVAIHHQLLFMVGGEPRIAFGDWEGQFPGQIAKYFGGDINKWLWLRLGAKKENGDYEVVFSPTKGD